QLDGDDKVYGFISPVQVGSIYDIRVRSRRGPAGVRTSPWQEKEDVDAMPPDFDLPAPTFVAILGGNQQILVQFSSPNSAYFEGMEFWGSDTDDVEAAELLDTVYGSANLVFEYVETGLP